ncbi:DUF2225 domain-containing protein [Petrocella sp. FN5]|uniref:DUF2225 domain-containing protein n=1 Tax=Petrocella sp. FN5 TaxID=3032002 RepID=UPI0023DC5DE1|nr:DUF2225 domain-containing protein [Petrocella sp. FN5]MDF1616684.1 DUF2225 domain-containing protein [Petrocella sp. FN5]
MESIFSDLGTFGLNSNQPLDFHGKAKDEKPVKKEIQAKKTKQLVFDRKVKCPVCDHEFLSKTVKSSINRFERTSLTLRPIYSKIDPLIYDVIQCNSCGYAALNTTYNKISERQIKTIKEQISSKFIPKEEPKDYDYKTALINNKLALYNAIVMGSRSVNKAYLCLRISWIIDGYLETIEEDKKESLTLERLNFIKNAYTGFLEAYETISFPVFGMNQPTYYYLLGVLAFELGDYSHSKRWLSKVMVGEDSQQRLKDKARDVKDLVNQKIKEEKEGQSSEGKP